MFHRVLRDPRRLQAAFVGVMIALTATLAWLGWKLIDQDRELEHQRLIVRREEIADLAVASLERKLLFWRERLESSLTDLPQDCLVVRFDRDSIRATPPGSLIYNPAAGEPAVADSVATALLETAGRESAEKRYAAAISTYARLEKRGTAPAAGMPAVLAAKLGRILMHEHSGNAGAAVTEARALARDLDAGRWPVSFASYKYFVNEARHRLPQSEQSTSPAEGLADSVTWLWDEWSASRLTGRWSSRGTSSGPVLLIWEANKTEGIALAATGTFVEREILAGTLTTLGDTNIRVSLESQEDGGPLSGDAPDTSDRTALRPAPDTGLPWTIRASAAGAPGPVARTRRTVIAGVGVLAAFVLTAAWFVGRSVTRELEVARLKSDFVAAVSHEFRTPLTTVVQLSELLKRGRVASESDRQAYYELVHAHGIRLQRLIERLLSFGQVESGRAQYQLAPIDIAALVTTCVTEFAETHGGSRHTFDCAGTEPVHAQADGEAMTTVVWNLLENAVKYSPDGGRIAVSVVRRADTIAIAVTDPGVGIPTSEQSQIFEPFVRGEVARDRQIRGTGVGLSLSRSIIRAHGGGIAVQSEPGAGSTFTVSLPVCHAS